MNVVSPGTGYYFSPALAITGTGNGAVVTSNISVQGVTLADFGYGWTQGQTFNVMISHDQIIVLEAAVVDLQGGLRAVDVIDGNSFDIFPQGKKVISNGNGSYAEVTFDLGISSANVVSSGSGYSITDNSTAISASGIESLPSWQASYQPYITIGTVYNRYNSFVKLKATAAVESLMSSIAMPVDMIYVTMQGRSWTGNTMFDDDLTQLDGGATRFTEWLEPLDTVFDDNGDTTFDVSGTRFDGNAGLGSWAYKVWGTTVWEPTTTIFDVYGLQIEDVDPVTASTTLVTKLYRLKSQQVGSFNKSL